MGVSTSSVGDYIVCDKQKIKFNVSVLMKLNETMHNESNLDHSTPFLRRLHSNKSSLLNLKLPLGNPVVIRKLNRSIDLLGLGLYCLTQIKDRI